MDARSPGAPVAERACSKGPLAIDTCSCAKGALSFTGTALHEFEILRCKVGLEATLEIMLPLLMLPRRATSSARFVVSSMTRYASILKCLSTWAASNFCDDILEVCEEVTSRLIRNLSADHPHLVHGLGAYFWDERPLRFIQKEANAETWMLTIIVQAIREAFLAAIADRRSSLVEAHSPAESPTTTDPVGRPKRRSPTKTKARRAKDKDKDSQPGPRPPRRRPAKTKARHAKDKANLRLNKRWRGLSDRALKPDEGGTPRHHGGFGNCSRKEFASRKDWWFERRRENCLKARERRRRVAQGVAHVDAHVAHSPRCALTLTPKPERAPVV